MELAYLSLNCYSDQITMLLTYGFSHKTQVIKVKYERY